jgi:hypothetical protein
VRRDVESATTRERARRRVVALVTVIYILLIGEGALRKWALPSFGQILFFLRDPFVLVVYWLAFRHALFPRGSFLLSAGITLGFLGVIIMVLQAMGPASGIAKWPLLAAYGWRNYFLYIPLPFVIGETFGQTDVRRLVRLTLLLAIPVAVLVMMQFRAPPDAPINIGFSSNLSEQFRGLTVDENHTRPMGPFTSDVGQREFVVSGVAMLLSLWILPASRRFIGQWLLLPATIAILSCLAVGGSRGSMVACGLVALAALLSSMPLRGSGASARAVLLPSSIVVIAVVLYPIVFPEGYSTFVSRWISAAAVESQSYSLGLFGRALYSFIDFVTFLGEAPLAGYGLGLAGNASTVLGVSIPGTAASAESDWARHIVDLGPLFGVLFMAYRVALVTWLGATCFRGARITGNPLPLLLFAYVGIELLYGQISGHGTVNGYAWTFAGLCIAASKAARNSTALPATRSHRPVAAVPFPNLLR